MLAAAERGPRYKDWKGILDEVLPVVPDDNVQTYLEAMTDLGNYNLLQPPPPGKPVPGGAQPDGDNGTRLRAARPESWMWLG